MKKSLPYLILIVFTHIGFAHELLKVSLGKEEKLEGTYSAEFESNRTIHVLLIKNTQMGKYIFSPYFVDANNKVVKLDPFAMHKKLQIVSYHSNGNIVTFLNYDEEEKHLTVLDFDLSSGKSKNSFLKFPKIADNIFRCKDKTTFVFLDKKTGISFKTIENSDKKTEISIAVPEDKIKVFKNAINEMPEAINQTEYVRNGSIQRAKSYLWKDKFVLTYENQNKEIEVFNFDLQTQKLQHSSFQKSKTNPLKDFGNYVFEDKIGTIGIEKEDAILSFYNLESLESISNMPLSLLLDKPIVTGFVKLAARETFKPTITVNKNVNGKFVIRLDNVNENTYSYNYNWWFNYWFFQQQFWNQQMMMQQTRFVPGRFGPNVTYLENDLYFYKDDSKVIEIVLDSDFRTILNDTKETELKSIDKSKYIDKYKENKWIKEFSSCFTSVDFRYIYNDKKEKTITIGSEKM